MDPIVIAKNEVPMAAFRRRFHIVFLSIANFVLQVVPTGADTGAFCPRKNSDDQGNGTESLNEVFLPDDNICCREQKCQRQQDGQRE